MVRGMSRMRSVHSIIFRSIRAADSIVWIVGEDGEYNPPSRDYMIQYRRNKLDRDNDGTVSEAEAVFRL